MTIALPDHPKHGHAVEVYAYEHTDGTACAQAKYKNGADSPKECAWWGRGSDGVWHPSRGDVQLPRLKPYNWQQLDSPYARSEPIIFAEGPKDTDTAIALGFVATDAKTLVKEHVEAGWYTGRDIIVVQDRDPPSSAINGGGYRDHKPGKLTSGERYAQRAKRLLTPVARRVAIVTMPGGVKELSDWAAVHPGTPEEKARALRSMFRHALDCAEGVDVVDVVPDPAEPEAAPWPYPAELWQAARGCRSCAITPSPASWTRTCCSVHASPASARCCRRAR